MVGTTFILVHGTGDEALAEPGQEHKWWQPESDYSQELLAGAPAGSRVEPFIWSGLNDEVSRRNAARELYRTLKSIGSDKEVVLVGHSHGGSVIATTLKLAAAAGKPLPQLIRWVTVGTPFIKMRRNILPWARYDALGLALFSFAIIGAITAIAAQIDIMDGLGFFEIGPAINRAVGIALTVISLLVLWVRSRAVRPLYPWGGLTKFEEKFAPRWVSTSSSHDEAVGALTRVSTLRPILFEANLPSGMVRAGLLIILIFFFSVGFLQNSFESVQNFSDSLEKVPLLGQLYNSYTELNESLLTTINDWMNDNFWDFFDDLPLISRDTVSVAGVSGVYLALMLTQIFVLLKVGDILSRLTFGRWIASALNSTAHSTITEKAFGNTTVGERALDAQSSPFKSISDASPMPDPANSELIAYAQDHAADTLADIHNEIFGSTPGAEIAIDRLVGQISWREMVHTAYFKVPSSRTHIVDLTLGRNHLKRN